MKIGNLEVYGIIYKITNTINGKVYIGQTTTGFNRRYDRGGVSLSEKVYMSHFKNKLDDLYFNKHLLYSMEKYGVNKFEVNTQLDIAFSKIELDIKEDVWIRLYNSVVNGYNEKYGGSNGKMSEESKSIMSANNRLENNPMYGRTHSEETRYKMVMNHWCKTGKYKPISLKGKDSHNYGRKLSEDTKRKISLGNKNKVVSESTKRKLSEGRMGENNPFAKKVICITTGLTFNTMNDAGSYYNIEANKISKCCRGEQKHCCGINGVKYAWSYLNEWSDMTDEEKNDKIKNIEHNESSNGRRVICVTTGIEFETAKKASIFYNTSASGVIACCRHKRKSSGKIDGIKLIWEYCD